jgi:hypothetical protein
MIFFGVKSEARTPAWINAMSFASQAEDSNATIDPLLQSARLNVQCIAKVHVGLMFNEGVIAALQRDGLIDFLT